MRMFVIAVVALSFVGLLSPIEAREIAVGKYYIAVDQTQERLAPLESAKATNRLPRQQVVEVFEVRNEWARVSKYYDGSLEGVVGEVARWVPISALSQERPEDLPQPPELTDPRIDKDAFPKVGSGGITADDLDVLHRGALKFLNNGRCRFINLAAKSVNKSGYYYVNCDKMPSNIFFTKSDLQ